MRSRQPFRSLRVPAEEPSEHGHHHAAPDRHDDGNELHRNPREQKDQVQNAESHAHQSEKDERNRQVEQQNAKREDEKVQCAQPGFAAQVFGGDLAAGKPRRGRAGPAERGHEQPQAGRGRDCGCISHSHVGQQPKASLDPTWRRPVANRLHVLLAEDLDRIDACGLGTVERFGRFFVTLLPGERRGMKGPQLPVTRETRAQRSDLRGRFRGRARLRPAEQDRLRQRAPRTRPRRASSRRRRATTREL